MQATTRQRSTLIRLLTLAVLMMMGLAPVQATQPDLITVAKFDSWYSGQWVVILQGEIAEDGSIQGHYRFVNSEEGSSLFVPESWGLFEGSKSAGGNLSLTFTTVESRDDTAVFLYAMVVYPETGVALVFADEYGFSQYFGTIGGHIAK
jgi:hypothetical protein